MNKTTPIFFSWCRVCGVKLRPAPKTTWHETCQDCRDKDAALAELARRTPDR